MSFSGMAQELNCQITLVYDRLQSADPQIFKTLETAIYEFMNNTKWTNNTYTENERIECALLLNITDEMGSGKYRATATIQSSRPVFNSSYNSVLLNTADKDWVFEYAQGEPLNYSDNIFVSNLTSLLGFYANVIIGFDKDAFSMKEGQIYFEKAMSIMNNIPGNLGDNAPGWKPFDGKINRYWLIENLLNPQFQPMREMFYQYHLQGLDIMYDNDKAGRTVILNSLKKLVPIAEQKPNAMLLMTFFNAKTNELVQIYSGASPNEKMEALTILNKIDAGNSPKYQKIVK